MRTVTTGGPVLTELVVVFDMSGTRVPKMTSTSDHFSCSSFLTSPSNADRVGIYSGDVGRLKRLREEISGQQARN